MQFEAIQRKFYLLRDDWEGFMIDYETKRAAEADQKLMESGFDPEEFESLSFQSKLDRLGPDHYDCVAVIAEKLIVSSHPHELSQFLNVPSRPIECPTVRNRGRCLMQSDLYWFECKLCNYSLCERCAKADLFLEAY
jgi:hypothetical protein